MKRYLPVFLSIILVISGMHLSVVSHFCGGKRAQTIIAFDPHAAGCGMENEQTEAKPETALQAPECCSNTAEMYATDGFYQFSSCTFKPVKPALQTVFVAPSNALIALSPPRLQLLTRTYPPGSLPFGIAPETLCVFRI